MWHIPVRLPNGREENVVDLLLAIRVPEKCTLRDSPVRAEKCPTAHEGWSDRQQRLHSETRGPTSGLAARDKLGF